MKTFHANVFESCRPVFLEIYDEQPQTEFSALFSEFTELCDANRDFVLEHFHRLRRAIGAGSCSSSPALCL